MNKKLLVIYSVVLIVGSAALTKYMWPTVQEHTSIQEKEVIKHDVRTVIKEKTNPDGSSERETVIVDHSKEHSSKDIEIIKLAQKDWFVASGATFNLDDVKPVYNLQINRRIIGPAYLGVFVNTRKDIGLQVGISF